MKYLLITIMVFSISAVAVWGGEFSLSFFPDNRAPSISLIGEYSYNWPSITFSISGEFSAWTYIHNPPTGYGPTFYVFAITPAFSFTLPREWKCNISMLLQYRTNLPNKIITAPEISFSHSW